MPKSKKKRKSPEQIPQPIKVKKEKMEDERALFPMAHYIDDRLEMIKQIFGTLKPKTITNLAPEFLKDASMANIEELCLTEILCISRKRLLAIINATKCPTDTETSSDTDIQHQKEHVSLEEISSGSEIEEGAMNGGVATKRRVNRAGAGRSVANGINGVNGVNGVNGINSASNVNGAPKSASGNGQISVLELLELQARARAIRSQLALEPITKIEVNSEDERALRRLEEAEMAAMAKSKGRDRDRQSKRKVSESEESVSVRRPAAGLPGSSANGSLETVNDVDVMTKKPAPGQNPEGAAKNRSVKRMKLKGSGRNSDLERNTSERTERSVSTEPRSEGGVPKQRKNSRSPSPDVVPIVAEPETLLINDSTDEADLDKADADKVSAVNGPHLVANGKSRPSNGEVSRRERRITEAEEGEISESESEPGGAMASTAHATQIVEETATVAAAEVPGNAQTEAKSDMQPTEAEAVDAGAAEENEEVGIDDNKPTAIAAGDTSMEASRDVDSEEKISDTCSSLTAEVSQQSSKLALDTEETNSFSLTGHSTLQTGLDDVDEEDDNDDIISIEGGDLESEMIEHLADETKSSGGMTVIKLEDETSTVDGDVISLDSTEDEVDSEDLHDIAKKSSQSWKLRYMKSDKMSRLLAESRLSKRVRDNIKRSKRSRDSQPKADLEAELDNSTDTFSSKHEDGSVEQYKELLDFHQRDT